MTRPMLTITILIILDRIDWAGSSQAWRSIDLRNLEGPRGLTILGFRPLSLGYAARAPDVIPVANSMTRSSVASLRSITPAILPSRIT